MTTFKIKNVISRIIIFFVFIMLIFVYFSLKSYVLNGLYDIFLLVPFFLFFALLKKLKFMDSFLISSFATILIYNLFMIYNIFIFSKRNPIIEQEINDIEIKVKRNNKINIYFLFEGQQNSLSGTVFKNEYTINYQNQSFFKNKFKIGFNTRKGLLNTYIIEGQIKYYEK